MATPHSMTSPNMTTPNPFASTDNDKATLDFLSFMGLDANGTSPSASFNLNNDNEAGPSRSNAYTPCSTMDDGRGTSTRGRTKSRTSRGKGDRSASSGGTGAGQDQLMEVDTSMSQGLQNQQGIQPFGPSQIMGMLGISNGGSRGGMDSSMGMTHEFDTAQASLLQQQVSDHWLQNMSSCY